MGTKLQVERQKQKALTHNKTTTEKNTLYIFKAVRNIFFLIFFWDYNYNIFPFPVHTSNPPIYPSCSLSHSWPFFFVITCTHVHLCTHIFLHTACSVCMLLVYVFKADYLVLDNQMLCSSLEKSISCALRIP